MTLLHASYIRRQLEVPENRSLMLSLSTGTFSVTDQGILARLQPPLTRLSAYYPWQFFPMGIATLRLLVLDSTELSDSVIDRLRLSEEDQTILDQKIGPLRWLHDGERSIIEYESEFCEDVERLVRWGVGLAERCPDQRVARDLIRLPTMSPPELNQYVRTWVS